MQRNPDIKLYGLPWGFPAWLGNGTGSPYGDPSRLATYVINWVKGAKQVHGLHIDYIGVSEQCSRPLQRGQLTGLISTTSGSVNNVHVHYIEVG